MLTTNQTFQGTVASISSSFLFSLMFVFGLFMLPLTGTQVASWRVLMMLLSLVLLVSFTKQWQHVFDYLRAHRLLVKPKRSYTKTTFSKHWMKKHPNLMKDAPAPIKPEQTLVADITYVTSKKGVHYLSLVTDAYSRQIMGYHLSENMPATEVVKAFKMAAHRRRYTHEAIHHSDRGLQYCASEYQEVLRVNNITPSMTDGYDCYQNALAERVNGILKNEFLLYECNTMGELKQLIDESVYVYNNIRPHLSLNMRTPAQVHDCYSCPA